MKRLLYWTTPIRLFCLLLVGMLVTLTFVNIQNNLPFHWDIFIIVSVVALFFWGIELLIIRFVNDRIRVLIWEALILALVLGIYAWALH